MRNDQDQAAGRPPTITQGVIRLACILLFVSVPAAVGRPSPITPAAIIPHGENAGNHDRRSHELSHDGFRPMRVCCRDSAKAGTLANDSENAVAGKT